MINPTQPETKMVFKRLHGRTVVGNMGSVLGTVKDIIFDENTGKMTHIDIEPSEQSPIPPTEDCYKLIPYKIVVAIKDVVVIDESKITKIKIVNKEER